ncbi:MAG: hypothetical protein QXV93_07470 [Zestosphaera sp.]
MLDGARVRCDKASVADFAGELPPHVSEYLVRRYADATLLLCTGRFTEVFVLSKPLARVVDEVLSRGITPYSAGLYLGRLRKGVPRFIPSTNILQEIYDEIGRVINAFVVADEGLKPFLYGGDILRKSVLGCYQPVKKREVVAILGADMRVYGLGLSKVDSCEELSEKRDLDEVASNIFDVGWYIRGEVRGERKYKT